MRFNHIVKFFALVERREGEPVVLDSPKWSLVDFFINVSHQMDTSIIDQPWIFKCRSCLVCSWWEVDVLKVGMIAQAHIVINLDSSFLNECGTPVKSGIVEWFVSIQLGV